MTFIPISKTTNMVNINDIVTSYVLISFVHIGLAVGVVGGI